MTYLRDGTQFVVIAAGGHGRYTPALGDAVVAYALPDGGWGPPVNRRFRPPPVIPSIRLGITGLQTRSRPQTLNIVHELER
jgi:hypothetical protein